MIARLKKDSFTITCWSSKSEDIKKPIKHSFEKETQAGQKNKRIEAL